MNNNDKKDKNIVDRFLEGYTLANMEVGNTSYKKIYQRPSKSKSVIGFILSLAIFIILVRVMVLNIIFLFILLGDLVALLFYGVNLFTKKGFGIPKYVKIDKNESSKIGANIKDVNDRYKVR